MPRGRIATRNFLATETTDYAGGERLLRVIGEVEVLPGVQVLLAIADRQGGDPSRVLLDLQQLEAGAEPAERRWTKVKVFEQPLENRRQFLNVDIRWNNDIVDNPSAPSR